MDDVIKDWNGLLMTGDQNTGKDGMSRSAILGTVAAIGLAGDDCGTQQTLSQVVGGLQVIDIEETQEVRSVLAQTSGKAGIVRIREAPGGGDQTIRALFEILCRETITPCFAGDLLRL